MSVRFPDEPGFQGRFAPVRLEGEIRGVEVTQGEIPASLRGTFYRVGADPAWPPFVERDFYFNADGMVAMFRFENGYCDFRSRYVRTPRFVAEREARRSLFGAYRNPFTDDPSVAGLSRGLANTNVYWHGGRLLASKEDSAPVQIDPDTLDTVGEFTWDGDLSSQTATAHPKIDPRTGELVFFGYMAKGEATRDIAYYEADASGRIVHEAWFEAPYSSMVHDWAVTENFVVFPIIPLTASLERLKAGGPLYVWDGSEDVYLGVVPRKGNRRPLVPGHQPVRLAHHERASTTGGTSTSTRPSARSPPFPWFPDITGAPVRPGEGERAAVPGGRSTPPRRRTGATGRPRSRSGGSPTAPASSPAPTTAGRPAGYRFGVINLTDVPGEKPDDGLPGFRWLGQIDPVSGHDEDPVRRARTARSRRRSSCRRPAPVLPMRRGVRDAARGPARDRDHGPADPGRPARRRAQPVATLRIPIRMPGGLHGNWVIQRSS